MCGMYWENRASYQKQADELYNVINELLERHGKIPTRYPEIERYRKTALAYNRLFNDGDPNWRYLGVYRDMIPNHNTWGSQYNNMWTVVAEYADKAMTAQLAKAWAEYLLMTSKECSLRAA